MDGGAIDRGRILLVHHSEHVLEALSGRLERHGYEVSDASSGIDALDLVDEAEAAFHVIILELAIPLMDGPELARRLREHRWTQQAPLVFLTQRDQAEDRARGLKAGADDLLHEDTPEEEMFTRIDTLGALGQLRAQVSAQRARWDSLLEDRVSPTTHATDATLRILIGVDAACAQRLQRVLTTSNRRIDILAPYERLAERTEATGYDVLICTIHDVVEMADPAFQALREGESPPSIVVVDEEASPERQILALKAGAEEYVSADVSAEELMARFDAISRRRQHLDTMRAHRDEARLEAITDPLTRLNNRGYFDRAFTNELDRARRYHRATALVLIDLDHFKSVNDRFGHPGGDAVLREAATRIQDQARQADIVARYGGEEIAVILPETNLDEAALFAERVRRAIANVPFQLPTEELTRISMSAGVAAFPPHSGVADDLIAAADAALYLAKEKGRDRVEVAESKDPTEVSATEHATQESPKAPPLLAAGTEISVADAYKAAAALLEEVTHEGALRRDLIEMRDLSKRLLTLVERIKEDIRRR